jgi:GT2 family glycosyltransferase
MKDVSVVIVTYKEGLDVLKACFDSVARQAGVSWELIVVDNGASEATRGLLCSYNGSTYIRNASNRGFAAAVNQGMKRSNGRYILLLNPDTSFGPETFAKMITHLDADQNVGIASSIIRYPDESLQESIRRFPRVIDQLLIMLKVPHYLKHLRAIDRYMMRDVDPLLTQDVDSIMGAFMWIRREVIEKIGWFDERYFIWFEEVDYCKMVHDSGWLIRHYADVEMTHHRGHTFNQIATRRKQKWIRTSLRKYMLKHHGVFSAGLFWLLTPIFIILGFVASIIKPK